MKYFPVVIIAFFVVVITSSCGNVKSLQYLQGSFDTARLSKVQVPEPVIQKGDLLSVSVYSDDALATAAVTNPLANSTASVSSTSQGGIAASGGTAFQPGFVVSQRGEIQLYKLGLIVAEGKTKQQLADTLTLLYTNQGLLKNPFVEVRFLNYKVTVIGEVNRPGQYSVPVDKVNAFEIIGMAGDITSFGRRDNVVVVRETNGIRQFGRLNLRDPNVFLSPYYYLQQNDMVIVDVTKNKAAANDQSTIRNISIATSVLSLAAVFISIFRR
jgi:polysaccharide export outer membrane protein